MADLPPLVRSGPLRGVWLRVRRDPAVEVDVSFNDREAPPGDGWVWVDESMVNSRVDVVLTSGEPSPPGPQIDETRRVVPTWDAELVEWVTPADAGLAQLDTGDDLPNAAVPFDTGLVQEVRSPVDQADATWSSGWPSADPVYAEIIDSETGRRWKLGPDGQPGAELPPVDSSLVEADDYDDDQIAERLTATVLRPLVEAEVDATWPPQSPLVCRCGHSAVGHGWYGGAGAPVYPCLVDGCDCRNYWRAGG